MMQPSREIETGNSIARQVVAAMDEQHESTHFIERGSTSSAFKVTTKQNEYILRLAAPRSGKSSSYESDFAIRQALCDIGQPVAEPIATNQSIDTKGGECWALDEFKQGIHPVRGAIASGVSLELGRLLRQLHNLGATGFGQLENTRDRLHGLYESPTEGMLSRLEAPWPFNNSRLTDHPAIRIHPPLQEKLMPMESELIAFVQESNKSTVVHSDLHEGQLLVDDATLMAVLDFNDAVVGRAEWDFGSFLYFHGDSCLSDLIDGYTSKSSEKEVFITRANFAAILIALHHGNRGVMLKRPHRVEASLSFLNNRLD